MGPNMTKQAPTSGSERWSSLSLRAKTIVAGVGQSTFAKRGQLNCDPFKLAVIAILDACRDAGLDPSAIDGFASFGTETCDPARLAAALGISELRHASLYWGGGGGGVCGALENAASAIATGQAQCIVVFRAISQPAGKRYGQLGGYADMPPEFAHLAPYGVLTPAQMFAPKIQRFLELYGVGRTAMCNIAMAGYHHAQNNPNAVMHGRPLTAEIYEKSRPIVDPLRLHDCCLETDGASAMILVASERKHEFMHSPCYLMAAASGAEGRAAAPLMNSSDYVTANFKPVARRLFDAAGLNRSDVDVVQSYENFTGGVMMALVDLGYCEPEEVDTFFQLENLIAPGGGLPLNTSGGHLAEAYVQGVNLCVEAVRQMRGISYNQVTNADVALVTGGPLIAPVSSAIFATEKAV